MKSSSQDIHAKYNIGRNLAHLIEQLYGKTSSLAPVNGVVWDWFDTTVGVGNRRLLFPPVFIVSVKRDALGVDKRPIGVRRRTVTNLRFADDIDGLLGEEANLANLVNFEKKQNYNYNLINLEKKHN